MRRFAVMLVSILGALLIAGHGHAHEASSSAAQPSGAARDAVRALDTMTQRLLSLQAQHYSSANDEAKRDALRDLLAVAAARQQRLAGLIEGDPGAVRRAALAAHERAALPREALRYVEEAVTVEGELDVLHEDHPAGARYIHWMNVGGTRLALHFASPPPALASGDRVRVDAVRVLGALAAEGGQQVSVTAAAAVPATFGAQNTAVILVSFSNAPGVASATVTQAQDVVFGGSTSVSNLY